MTGICFIVVLSSIIRKYSFKYVTVAHTNIIFGKPRPKPSWTRLLQSIRPVLRYVASEPLPGKGECCDNICK